jgi:hypothetical protein
LVGPTVDVFSAIVVMPVVIGGWAARWLPRIGATLMVMSIVVRTCSVWLGAGVMRIVMRSA